MENQTITLKAYQAKCKFCGQLFTEFKSKVAETKRNEHMYNNCPVLRCVCIVKDMDYPILVRGNGKD